MMLYNEIHRKDNIESKEIRTNSMAEDFANDNTKGVLIEM